MSAASIMNAIDRERFEVIPVGITKDGRWLRPADAARALQDGLDQVGGTHVALTADPSVGRLVELGPADVPVTAGEGEAPGPAGGEIDVVFPVLHGPFGEDGTVQGLCELAGLPYVGSGVLGSAVGMDKVVMKALFLQAGLPVIGYRVFKRREWEGDRESILDRMEAELGYPCFVKPANLGSSVGVSKAGARGSLAAAVDEAARFDRKIIVERAVPGVREVECSVLGNDDPMASIPGEIVPCNEFYDYRAKYIDEGSQLFIPADLPRETAARVRRLALEAYLALDCAGMARVDFFLSAAGEIYVNEVNTIPGFTKISMYPKLWEATGIGYSELITRLIDLALERQRDKMRSATSYQLPQASAPG